MWKTPYYSVGQALSIYIEIPRRSEYKAFLKSTNTIT